MGRQPPRSTRRKCTDGRRPLREGRCFEVPFALRARRVRVQAPDVLAGIKKKGFQFITLERIQMVGPNKEGAKGSYTVYNIPT